MKEKLQEVIKNVSEKAINTMKADDALKFTQAALNAAHALATLDVLKKEESK